MIQAKAPYPVQFSVEYPERPLNRLTSAFRIFVIIPVAIVLALVSGGPGSFPREGTQVTIIAGEGGVLFAAPLLMILFRRKYPRWWFDWNLQLTRFTNRVVAYVLLLRDEYPSTDEEQAVHLEIPYPAAQTELNRWLPLVKWLLAIPHYIILVFLGLAALAVVVIAWFAILFTGSYPRGLHDFVVGVMRWGLRVEVYAFILATDRYPPFQFAP